MRQLTSYKPPPSVAKGILHEINDKLFCCALVMLKLAKWGKKNSDEISLHSTSLNSLNIQENVASGDAF